MMGSSEIWVIPMAVLAAIFQFVALASQSQCEHAHLAAATAADSATVLFP